MFPIRRCFVDISYQTNFLLDPVFFIALTQNFTEIYYLVDIISNPVNKLHSIPGIVAPQIVEPRILHPTQSFLAVSIYENYLLTDNSIPRLTHLMLPRALNLKLIFKKILYLSKQNNWYIKHLGFFTWEFPITFFLKK